MAIGNALLERENQIYKDVRSGIQDGRRSDYAHAMFGSHRAAKIKNLGTTFSARMETSARMERIPPPLLLGSGLRDIHIHRNIALQILRINSTPCDRPTSHIRGNARALYRRISQICWPRQPFEFLFLVVAVFPFAIHILRIPLFARVVDSGETMGPPLDPPSVDRRSSRDMPARCSTHRRRTSVSHAPQPSGLHPSDRINRSKEYGHSRNRRRCEP